jgi:hypothetical protein
MFCDRFAVEVNSFVAQTKMTAVRIGRQQAPGLFDLFASNLASLQNKCFGHGRTKIEELRK